VKLTLDSSGGLAAGLRLGRRSRALDSASLPEPEARRLADLVREAVAEGPPDPGEGSATRDGMSYTVTVVDGGAPVVVHRSDGTMSPAFADLLDWLETHLPAEPG
jgi:hypothetical protein